MNRKTPFLSVNSFLKSSKADISKHYKGFSNFLPSDEDLVEDFTNICCCLRNLFRNTTRILSIQVQKFFTYDLNYKFVIPFLFEKTNSIMSVNWLGFLFKNNDKKRKGIAFFFLLLHFSTLFLPIASYAITQGPAQPEYATFEPVSSSNIVDVNSGDLQYSIPVINIPVGDGNIYPMNLSYHSGIKVTDEASWVGLGWNLTPGAISRNIVGFPDDYNNSTIENINIENSYGFSLSSNIPIRQSDQRYIGVRDPKWITSAQYGSLLGFFEFGFGGSSTSLNFVEEDLPFEATHGSQLILTAIFTAAMAEYRFQYGIGNRHRYGALYLGEANWSKINKSVLDGPIDYFDEGFPSIDCSSFFDTDNQYNEQYFFENETHDLPNIPDYDEYQVSVENLAGSFRPFCFEPLSLQNRNVKVKEYAIDYNIPYGQNQIPYQYSNKLQFRFVGDNSGKYSIVDNVNSLFNGSSTNKNSYLFRTVTADKFGLNNNSGKLVSQRYIEYYTNKDIKNGIAQSKGFIDIASNTNRSLEYEYPYKVSSDIYYELNKNSRQKADVSNLIGGFSITNANGVTYHFSIPVMNYSSHEFINDKVQNDFSPYAISWLLTSVTGSDFVDRNNNGIADQGDWGYWINFRYGKWTEQYKWRTENVGKKYSNLETDIASSGVKEQFYLNSIETKSHVCLFVKDIRKDGKSASSLTFGTSSPTGTNLQSLVSQYYFRESGCCNLPISSLKLNEVLLFSKDNLNDLLSSEGISDLTTLYANSQDYQTNLRKCIESNSDISPNKIASSPTDIYLQMGNNILDVKDVAYGNFLQKLRNKSLRSVRFSYDYTLCPYTWNSKDIDYSISGQENYFDSVAHYGNFLDANHFAFYPYEHSKYLGCVSDSCAKRYYEFSQKETFGKLTLNRVTSYGKGGVQDIPPTDFYYDDEKSFQFTINSFNSNALLGELSVLGSTSLKSGDILKCSLADKEVYLHLVSNTTNNSFKFIVLFSNDVLGFNSSISASHLGTTLTGYLTKNPPCSFFKKDFFGYYNPQANFIDYTSFKYNSEISSKSKDSWNLTRINSQLGNDMIIEYESDKASEFLYKKNNFTKIEKTEFYRNGSELRCKLFFEKGVDIEPVSVGQNIDFRLIAYRGKDYVNNINSIKPFLFSGSGNVVSKDEDNSLFGYKSIVLTIQSKTVVAESDQYYNIENELDNPPSSNNIPTLIDGLNDSKNICLVGYVKMDLNSKFIDGIKVKSIKLVNNISDFTKTIYDYKNTGWSLFNSNELNFSVFNSLLNSSHKYKIDFLKEFVLESFNFNSKNILKFSPPNNVFYSSVSKTVQSSDNYNNGREEYDFDKFQDSYFSFTKYSKALPVETFYKNGTQYQVNVTRSALEVSNTLSRVNLPTDIKTFDKNGTLTQYTKNYFQSISENNSTDEVYYNVKFVNVSPVPDEYGDGILYSNNIGSSLIVHNRNVKLVKQELFKNNTLKRINFSDYDQISGQFLRTSFGTSFGDQIDSLVIMAYKMYPSMGSKVDDISNRNMLNASAGYYKYLKTAGQSAYRPIGASIQTWNNKWKYREFDGNQDYFNTSVSSYTGANGIWHKHENYTWKGELDADGAFAGYSSVNSNTMQSSSDFDFAKAYNSITQSIPGWTKIGEVTLYDHFSKSLEEKDINSNYAATKLGYGETLPIATASNSNYFSFTASSFEDANQSAPGYFGGEVNGAITTNLFDIRTSSIIPYNVRGGRVGNTHTGYYSLKLSSGNSAQVYKATVDNTSVSGGLQAGKKYIASVWMKNGSANGVLTISYMNGTSAPVSVSSSSIPGVTNGDWKLYNLVFDVPTNTSGITLSLVANGGDVYFDDFRVQPLNASVSSYVYDDFRQVTHILDNTNMYTRFVYDEMGRLKETWKETKNGEKLISQSKYNYAKPL